MLIKPIIRFGILCSYLSLLVVYLNYWIGPAQSYIVSFFGLGYLPIVLIFFVAIFFASFQSRKLLLLGIGIFLIGIKLHLGYFSIASENESTTDKSLKILSYNVRLFDLYAKPDGSTKQKIFDYLKEEDADIYCFQEFYYREPPTKFLTKEPLMNLLNTPYVNEHYSFVFHAKQYFGVALMSKYPMVTKGDVSFEDEEHNDNNYCIYADIVPSKGDTIRVYNTHLQSTKISQLEFLESQSEEVPSKRTVKEIFKLLKEAFEKRQAQVDKVVQHIKESPYPVVLTGDFNDTPLSYSYLQFYKILKDAFRENKTGIGTTYVGKLPVGRIDYIFYSDSLNAYDFDIQRIPLSDHYAISAKINY